MNFATLIPFLASMLRHVLVAGGILELSKADDVSNQLASSLITLVGIGWSFYNAHKTKRSQP